MHPKLKAALWVRATAVAAVGLDSSFSLSLSLSRSFSLSLFRCVYLCVCVSGLVCMHVCMHAFFSICLCVCVHMCMLVASVCMYGYTRLNRLYHGWKGLVVATGVRACNCENWGAERQVKAGLALTFKVFILPAAVAHRCIDALHGRCEWSRPGDPAFSIFFL